MSDIVYLSNVRLSFPHLIEPQITKDPTTGNERRSYNCEILVKPEDPGFAAFMKQCQAIALAKWGENAGTVLQMIQNDRKMRCFAKGEEKISKKTFKPYDTHVGMMSISAGRDTPPQMIQADGKPVDPMNSMAYQAMARQMYAGCRVNVALKPWAQNNKHGVAIRCDLVALQFAGDDKPFGEGSIDASGMFGAVAAAPTAVAAQPAMPATPFPSFLGGQ